MSSMSSSNQPQQPRSPPRSPSSTASASGSASASASASASGSASTDAIRHSLTWSLVNAHGSIPPARSGAASVIVGNKLYMFGGYGGETGGRLDDFYSYSFDTNTWEEVEVQSEDKPGCRENNGVVIGDSSRVYLFGGYNGQAWLNDLWTFDIETKCWTCLQESSDENEHQNEHGDVNINLNMNMNMDMDANSNVNANGHANAIPSRRFGYVSVVHNKKFILWGGFDGAKWLNDMYEFDFTKKQWRTIHAQGNLPSVRSCPAWSKDDRHVYIQGGYDGVERKCDFYSCDLSTYTWMEMPANGTPPTPRYFHTLNMFDNKMYAYGGYNGEQRLSDMYCYDFDTKFWSQVDCTNCSNGNGYGYGYGHAPNGRSSLVAQVYGNDLYIFGGYNGETVLNDFHKFRLKAINVPPSNYKDDMLRLINNSDLSDVTFLVEGKRIYANRAILASRSKYFHTMLFGACMKERIQTSTEASSDVPIQDRKPIEIKDVSYAVFLKMLEYIYTDSLSLTGITLEIGIPLLITSERFMLDRLKAICEDAIRCYVTVDNVSDILLTSHRHNAAGLKNIALEFILGNLNQQTIIQNLTDLKAEPDLLIEIIRRNSLQTNHQSGTCTIQPQTQTPPGPFGYGSERWSGSRR